MATPVRLSQADRLMTLLTKSYLTVILASGTALCAVQLLRWNSDDPVRFLAYFLATLIAASLKVRLPDVNGTLSVYFVFILIGIVQLSLPEVVCLSCGAAAVQSLWHTKKRPELLQVSFNICSIALAGAASYMAYRLPLLSGLRLSLPVEVALASIVFFLSNTTPIAIIIGLTEGGRPFKIWKECYFWCFPYYMVGAAIACLFQFITQAAGWQTALLVLPSSYVIFWSYRLYLGRLEDEKTHAEAVAALHLRTIEALALAIDAKDHTTHAHLQRVQLYAVEIGKMMGLAGNELKALQAASLLHDIGKLAVPEHIISKPGKLTPEEFEKMKIHPTVGAEILDRVEFPYPVSPVVRAHHEKWNGTGYPNGLSGEEIPIGARILSAVDCLDALASDRQYRRALSLDQALEIVVSESGKSYDPKVVEVLRLNCRKLEAMVRSQKVREFAKLSDTPALKGDAPDAGYECSRPPAASPQSADFLQSIAKARQEAQTLFELAQTLGSSLSLNDTLSMMTSRLKNLVAYDAVVIHVVQGRKLCPEYAAGEDFRMLSSLSIPMGEGLCGWVAENRKPILNGNPAVEPGYAGGRLQSAIAVPLETANGVIGVLSLYHTERDAFSRDQLRILQAVSSKLSASVENALRFAKAETSATTDYVTSLPNARSLFLHLGSAVGRAAREESGLSVLVCDLDGFKKVNDRFGHLVGNQVLARVAGGLKALCRQYDYVARMGGDEFVVVLPGISPEAAQTRIAELHRVAVQSGLEEFGESFLGMSVGLASFPEDGRNAESLLAEADRRMYKQKQVRTARRAERVLAVA